MKRFLTLFVAIIMASNLMAVNVWDGSSEPWTNGSGTKDDPYLIETAANLAYLAEKVNEGYEADGMAVFRYTYFLMTDDFDLDNINWTPIGNVNMSIEGYYFAGDFDGWYHNIDHLRITSNADVCGLFGGLGGEWCGILGNDDFGQIKHLSVTNGNITSTGTGAAGIVGVMVGDAMVSQCSFSGSISVNSSGSYCGVGGIVAAMAENSVVQESSNSGSISATCGGYTSAAGAGGIAGIAMNGATIKKCYNAGSVSANAFMFGIAAGILGATMQENEVEVVDCYNVGTISGKTKGGIFGMVSPIDPFKGESSLTVSNCYYLNTCGGTTNYGESKTSAEMQTEEFKNAIDNYAHAFVMDNGTNNGYPIHSLFDYSLGEAAEVTSYSAVISADIHEGNDHLAEVKFIYYDLEDGAINEMYNVVIDYAEHVELLLEDLVPETDYGFLLSMKFDDNRVKVSSPHFFTTGINDAVPSSEVPEIQAYPNPATDLVHIKGVDVTEVQLFNVVGQLMKTVRWTNDINVGDLENGQYLLRITSAKPEMLYVLPLSKHSH